MNNNRVTLLGATGLIGGHVLQYLINDKSVTNITTILRRKAGINHPKVKEVVINFQDKESFQKAVDPHSTIYCAIGTTNSKVKGDKEKYRSIDYDIPVNAAKIGISKGCDTFVLVSSMGANAKSSNFYTNLKGKVEVKVSSFGYKNLHIFRPSILLGKRQEFRFGEKLAKTVMKTFSFLLPSKIKPIQAKDVAISMVKASKHNIDNIKIYHYKDILRVAKES